MILFDKIVFGPVVSRRFGKSLGINLLPLDNKVCNFSCIYCECGWTNVKNTKVKYTSYGDIVSAMQIKFKELGQKADLPDVITFAGNGEPTMHPQFLRIIEDTIRLRNLYMPKAKIVILSNGVLMNKPDVLEALFKVDLCVMKFDAGNDKLTGIDVPEVVNLVFAKPVKSKVKFWQMIGRGTRVRKNLFGPGEDKTEFLIFDHWDSFSYHDMNPEEAEPKAPKALTERRYEARIELAELALQRSDLAAFAMFKRLLQDDAQALNDATISVRDNWQSVQTARDEAILEAFAPTTRQILRESVAPLMATLDVRGEGEALRWDLLLGRAQYEAIALPGQPNPLRADILAWLARLPAHLNPVRAKAEMLRRIRSDEFWTDADCASLEDMRLGLRDIIHLAERASQPPPLPPTVLDIKEEAGEIQYAERPTKIKSVDYGIFRKAVEGALKPLFDTSPVLKKIRFGEAVSAAELLQLNSLVHTRHPDVDLATLLEIFPDTALPLEQVLRSIVGLDHAVVEARFAGFAGRYPLSSQQLRFLTLLKDHIRQYGAIATDTLFEAPFTSVHTEGLSGVFHDETQLSEIVALIRSFGEPPSPAAR